MKIDYSVVKQAFVSRGYILKTQTYQRNDILMDYMCPKHIDKGILKISYANLRRGRGCPYCAKRAKRTPEEYNTELANSHSDIIAVEPYVNLKTPILHKCLRCGHEWMVKPTNVLHLNHSCPRCAGRNTNRTQDEFISDVERVNPNILVLDKYVNTTTKIRFQCKQCQYIWKAKPNNILFGKGCPHCKSSRGEIKIAEVLCELNISYVRQYKFLDCVDELCLPFDFYIPQYNCCIEYDGEQHFKPIRFGNMSSDKAICAYNKCVKHDNIKTQYCIKHNIKLIRISYLDFNNIKNILLSNFN